MGLMILVLAAMSWLPQKWWYSGWALYIILFPVTLKIADWNGYKGQIEGELAARRQLATIHKAQATRGQPASAAYNSDNTPIRAGRFPPAHPLQQLAPMTGLDSLPHEKIGLPLGDNETMERYLKLQGRYVPEYITSSLTATCSSAFGPGTQISGSCAR